MRLTERTTATTRAAVEHARQREYLDAITSAQIVVLAAQDAVNRRAMTARKAGCSDADIVRAVADAAEVTR